ncbi:type II toxin-antitoxin system HicA family toxin [Allopusillimonas ginsengisoli]|nr:type II toxin-antitoxin system HicA family toxin [Allopusillimonas ginsengisoli]
MGNCVNGYYESVIAVFKRHGFLYVRQKGSHQMWRNGEISVIVSTNCASRHTANGIMKAAKIKHRF